MVRILCYVYDKLTEKVEVESEEQALRVQKDFKRKYGGMDLQIDTTLFQKGQGNVGSDSHFQQNEKVNLEDLKGSENDEISQKIQNLNFHYNKD